MNTMLCQLKSLLLLGVLLFANGAFGQPMIWDDTSPETIVFELTNKEALKLLKGINHLQGEYTILLEKENMKRKDAKVRVGSKAVYYDEDSQTYTDDNWSQKEQHILTVEVDKFRSLHI